LKRLRRQLDSQHSSRAGAAPPADSRSTVAPPAPASDSQVFIELVRKNRGRVAVVAVAIALAIAIAVAYTIRRPAAGAGATASLEDLQVLQLTTSGNAERAVISPDGRYVTYIQRDAAGTSLWVLQVATGSTVQLVAAQPGVRLDAATVTPDGAFVDFNRFKFGDPPSMWRVPLLGGTPRRLIDHASSPIGWSRSVDQQVQQSVVVCDLPDCKTPQSGPSRSRRPARFAGLPTEGSHICPPTRRRTSGSIASMGARRVSSRTSTTAA
jgi:hypothetical protein